MSILHADNPDNQQFAANLRRKDKELCEMLYPIKIILADGTQYKIPQEFRSYLIEATKSISIGKDVELRVVKTELSTQDAANALNVSRPFLIKLLNRGEIPYRKVGTHRRIRKEDLETFQKKHEAKAKKALEQMMGDAEEMGLDY